VAQNNVRSGIYVGFISPSAAEKFEPHTFFGPQIQNVRLEVLNLEDLEAELEL